MKAVTCLIGMCLLAGLVSADYGWKAGKQYQYNVRGRIMTGISEIDRQYSGMQLEYVQQITPKQSGEIYVQTRNLKVLEVKNQILKQGWREAKIQITNEVVVDEKFRQYLSSPMIMTLKKGVVESIQVQANLPQWVVNMKKAMATVWTLDTTGSGSPIAVEGNLNRPTQAVTPIEANQQSGYFFETLEETVHGECETYYTVSQNGPFDAPYPFQQEGQSSQETQGERNSSSSSSSSSESGEGNKQPSKLHAQNSAEQSENNSGERTWATTFKSLCHQNDQVYEIIKTINFTACRQKPVLAYSTPDLHFRPGDNAGGSLWQRSLVSRYLACGENRRNYTILKVNQQERFYSGLLELEKVIAGAQKNITLISITDSSSTPKLPNSETINDLIYIFGNRTSDNGNDADNPDFNCTKGNVKPPLPKPSLDEPSLTSITITNLTYPEYEERVNKLMKLIVTGMTNITNEDNDSIARREVLSKISAVVKVLRRLHGTTVRQLARKWVVPSQEDQQQVGRNIFLDALAIAGTNPCVSYLLKQIEQGKILGEEAAQILAILPLHIRTPTKELLEQYFKLVESLKSSGPHQQVRTTAMLSFSTLVYNACVNKRIKNTRYPVAIYGEFCNEQYAAQKFVKSFVDRLEKRISSKDRSAQAKHWIITLLATLGNFGHPDTIEVVQKILDQETDHLIKVKAVYALKHLVQSRSTLNLEEMAKGRILPVDRQSVDVLTNEVIEKQVLPVLVSVAFDRGEHPEVRNAAYSLLFYCTFADVTVWQQIAMSTWFEQCRDVHSFIISSLKSFAQLHKPITPIGWVQQRKARAVLPLAKSIDASVLRSHNVRTSQFFKASNTGYAQNIHFFQSEDSIIPNHVYYQSIFNYGNGASTISPLQFSLSGNTIQKLISTFTNAFATQSEDDKQKPEELEAIDSHLNITRRNQHTAAFGALFVNLQEEVQRLWTFDNQSIVALAKDLLKQGKNGHLKLPVNYQKAVHLTEHIHTMPSILGVPLTYNYRMPTLISVVGNITLQSVPHSNPEAYEPDFAIQADLAPVYAWKVHRKLAFKCPLTGKKYQAGVQRHFVVEAPMIAVVRNTTEGLMQLAVTPGHPSENSQEGSIDLVTYHQLPYTAVIYDELWPTIYPEGGNMRIVHAKNNEQEYKPYKNTRHFGQSLRLNFMCHEISDFPQEKEEVSGWMDYLHEYQSTSGLLSAAWLGSSSLRFVERKLVLHLNNTNTKTIVLEFTHKSEFVSVAEKIQANTNELKSAGSRQNFFGSHSQSFSSSSSESAENNLVAQTKQAYSQKQQKPYGRFGLQKTKNNQFIPVKAANDRQHSSIHVLVAIFGKKQPLLPLAIIDKIMKQKPLDVSEKTVQYLLHHSYNPVDSVATNWIAGKECKAYMDVSTNLDTGSYRLLKKHIESEFNAEQHSACLKFLGKPYTSNVNGSRHIVAVRRAILLDIHDLTFNVTGKVEYGTECNGVSDVIKYNVGFHRDEEMKEWARSKSPEAKKCIQDEKKGFEVSQICMDVSEQQAAALNEVTVTLKAQRGIAVFSNITNYFENVLKVLLPQYISENVAPPSPPVSNNTVQIYSRITPNKQFVTLEILKPTSILTFKNVKTNKVAKALLPFTSTQTIYGNAKDRLFRSQSDSMCSIQNNYVNTFDNVTYSFHQQAVRGCVHVLAKDCSGRHPMAVLVNNLHQQSGRTVTILLGGAPQIQIFPAGQGGQSNNPETQLRASEGMIVRVGGQVVSLPRQIPNHPNSGKKPIAEIMEMPNGGVQVIGRHIEVATDGERVIVYGDNIFRNRTCGICGNFDNEKIGELRSPRDVPLSSGTLMVASYVFDQDKSGSQCQVKSEVQQQIAEEEKLYRPQGRYVSKNVQRGQSYVEEQEQLRQYQRQYRQKQLKLQMQQRRRQSSSSSSSSSSEEQKPGQQRKQSSSSSSSSEERFPGQQRNQSSSSSSSSSEERKPGQQGRQSSSSSSSSSEERKPGQQGKQSSSSSSSSSEERKPGQKGKQSSSSSSSEERKPGQKGKQSSSSSSSSEERRPGQQGKQSSSSSSSSEERKPGQQGKKSSSSSSSSSEERKPGQQGKQSSSSSSSSSEERKPGQKGKQSSSSSSSSEERFPGQKRNQSSSSSSSSSEEAQRRQHGGRLSKKLTKSQKRQRGNELNRSQESQSASQEQGQRHQSRKQQSERQSQESRSASRKHILSKKARQQQSQSQSQSQESQELRSTARPRVAGRKNLKKPNRSQSQSQESQESQSASRKHFLSKKARQQQSQSQSQSQESQELRSSTARPRVAVKKSWKNQSRSQSQESQESQELRSSTARPRVVVKKSWKNQPRSRSQFQESQEQNRQQSRSASQESQSSSQENLQAKREQSQSQSQSRESLSRSQESGQWRNRLSQGQQQQQQQQEASSGIKQQQRVIRHPKDSEKMCFSLTKLPVCEQEYQPKKMTQKTVQVYCQKQGLFAQQIKNQVQAGHFRDFSGKPVESIRVTVPLVCVRA